MSTYASTVVTGNVIDGGQLVTELQALAGSQASASASSVISTASTSFVTAFTTNVAFAVDEVVQVIAELSLSVSDGTAHVVSVAIFVDGTQATLAQTLQGNINSTSGATMYTTAILLHKDTTGTKAVDIRWKVDGGTAYSSQQVIQTLKFKRRT